MTIAMNASLNHLQLRANPKINCPLPSAARGEIEIDKMTTEEGATFREQSGYRGAAFLVRSDVGKHEAHVQTRTEKAISAEAAPDGQTSMDERGEKGMGFSQTDTTHHFILRPDGGAMQVEANDPADTASRDAIRQHLTHIAQAFSKEDFNISMFVHDAVPAGVTQMTHLRANIHYSYEATPRGGRVLIAASDRAALEAIHTFLRFQIEEHKTGDPIMLR